MLVKDQYIKVKWANSNKKWFEGKGYLFTAIKDEFLVKAEDLMPTSKYRVMVVCDFCGKEYETEFATYFKGIHSRDGKNACNYCKSKKGKQNYAIDRATPRYKKVLSLCDKKGFELISDISIFSDLRDTFIEILCPIHGVQRVRLCTFIKSGNCPACSYEQGYEKHKHTTDEVYDLIYSINGNILLNKDEYIDCKTPNLKIKCSKCGRIFVKSLEKYMSLKTGCSYCGKEIKKLKPDEVEEIINSKNGNILLNKGDYVRNNVKNLKVKCGSCGDVFITSLASYQSGKVQCSKCSNWESRGEQRIKDILNDLKISFLQQYWFPDCKIDKRPLSFDFYLDDLNTLIEFQGKQHYEPIEYFGGEETFKSQQTRDDFKREYCKVHNIDLLEIPYWEFNNIDSILKDSLLDK